MSDPPNLPSPPLPQEVLLVVMVVAEPGPRTPMTLWTMRDARTAARLTPGFSSMAQATAFLADARAGHQAIPVDYIFRCDRSRFQADFPDLELVLDPSAAQFFARGGKPPSFG